MNKSLRQKLRRRRYLWKVAQWEQCSKSCGKGVSKRIISCVDLASRKTKVVVDKLCNRRPKPKDMRFCNKHPCPFRWNAGDWSKCSHTCGHGVQTRRVSCHRVNSLGWVDPEVASITGCNSTAKPSYMQSCS